MNHRAAALKAWVTIRAKRMAAIGGTPAPAKAGADDFAVCKLCGGFRDRPHACAAVLQARELVAQCTGLERRAWGTFWVEYCVGNLDMRPKAKCDVRDLELRLARLGIVDPLGFAYAEENTKLKRRTARRGPVGDVPEELARYRENNRRGSYIG